MRQEAVFTDTMHSLRGYARVIKREYDVRFVDVHILETVDVRILETVDDMSFRNPFLPAPERSMYSTSE